MNNKIALTFVCIFLLITQYVFSDEFETCRTDGLLNGRSFQVDTLKDISNAYVYGAIDTLYLVNPKRMHELYPRCTLGDIVEAVKLYYQNNPTKRHVAIIDVLVSGAK